jgi:flagellar assembly protein FliH
MATIIRQDSPLPSPAGRDARPVAFSFADMRSQADDYLDTVRAEASKIIGQAHRQAEQIRREAEAAGREAAEAAIEKVLDEKVARRMDTLLPALEQLARQINDAKGTLQSHCERLALKVCTAIAERIIRRELAREPQITLELIAETLRLAAGAAEITVHLNPIDYQNLGSQVERLAKTLCQLAPSDIVADPEITAGGCRVETKFGAIDRQIEAQLRRIEEDLAPET